ncbi:hypothetical protein ACHAPX_006664 [Trichoderma viride]
MSLPKAPVKSLEHTMEWMSTAPEDIRDPEFLCTKEEFDIAIGLASISNDKITFEKLFQQTIRRRQAEVRKWYADFKRNAWREGQSFPCGGARILGVEFCRTGSLNSVLQILDGVAYGWKNDECLVDGAPVEPLSDDGSEIPLTQFWDKEEDLWYGDMTPSNTPDGPHIRHRGASEAPSEASTMESSNS